MKQFLFTDFQKCGIRFPFVLRGLGIGHPQEAIDRPEGLPLFQWIQCVEGKGRMQLAGHEFEIAPGQGIFLYPDMPHAYAACEMPWTVHFICFEGFAVGPLLQNSALSSSGVYTVEHPEALEQLLMHLTEVPGDSTMVSCCEYSRQMYDILIYLMLHTNGENGTTMTARHHRLTPVLRYVEDHFDRQLTLDELAELCQVTPEYLCQLFKNNIGMRVFDYVNQVRIRHSKEMLLEMKEIPAGTVGKLCGFENTSYFSKIFKRYEGITPGAFRKLHGM